MTHQEKQTIKTLLTEFIERYPSQKQATRMLKNVSEATVINIVKDKWDSVSEDMWRNVGKQVGWKVADWNLAETRDLRTLVTYFEDAKTYGNVFAISGPSGSGKTAVADWMVNNRPNVYHVVCAEYWNRKMFLRKILQALGRDDSSYSTAEQMDAITDTLMKQDCPLLILDEADKLTDHVLYFFITLYNVLEGKCGIVLLATDFLEKRVLRGVRLRRKGYAEIFSRVGRRFIALPGSNKREVSAICKANGIDDMIAINSIYNEYDGDLRRVKRMVHKIAISAPTIENEKHELITIVE